MEEGTQGEQLVMRLPQERLPQGEVGEGEGTRLLLSLDLSLSQRECKVKEGEGTRLLLSLDHPPSCNNSTEIPPAQRECQAKEGEGTRLLPDLDHPPGSSSSQEIPAHHPGGQLA
jgi:hypothetical protein